MSSAVATTLMIWRLSDTVEQGSTVTQLYGFRYKHTIQNDHSMHFFYDSTKYQRPVTIRVSFMSQMMSTPLISHMQGIHDIAHACSPGLLCKSLAYVLVVPHISSCQVCR